MEGSWSIGRVAGIPVRVHWTLLALAVVFGLMQGAGAVAGLAGAVLLFGSVVVHEVAHALVARGYGIGTRDIVLTPIGGVARLDGMPASGHAEVAIALAGPAASLALAAGAWGLGLVFTKGILALVLGTLASSNLMLGLFNLVPAFPMDGGRVLRGLLHEHVGLRVATDVAARLGRVAAVLMGIGGLFAGMPSLVLIAVFVWMASGRERDAVELEESARAWRGPTYRARAWGFAPAGRTWGSPPAERFWGAIPDERVWRSAPRTEAGPSVPRAWDEHGRPIHAELVGARPAVRPIVLRWRRVV